MKIQLLSKIFVVLLWVSTLAVALCWMFWKEPPFEPEPVTVLLGLISTAVTALLNEFGSRLEEEEFSLPYALAYGYVNNFLIPLVTQLAKQTPVGGKSPQVFIFLPESMSDLEPAGIEQMLAQMRIKGFHDSVVNLQFQEGRARDILTINHNNKRVYFDFPNTLLSLNSLIEYQVESRKNTFSSKAREELAQKYIEKFKQVLGELIAKKKLKGVVFFVDKELNFNSSLD